MSYRQMEWADAIDRHIKNKSCDHSMCEPIGESKIIIIKNWL